VYWVSVVIPTYNRSDRLRNALHSVARQTLGPEQYEVIVVDDGSADSPEPPSAAPFPAALQLLRQDNQGATQARNAGARVASGQVLIFMDDDITVCPETLSDLAEACTREDRLIALGTLVTPDPAQTTVFARLNSLSTRANGQRPGADVPFTECKTGLLALRRADFMDLGGFQDPGGGWPNWDDVEFGYRANQRGFRFRYVASAVGQHWDYALTDLATACRRWEAASRSAVWLFEKYPEVRAHIPMFVDKAPILWGEDPPRLLVRKLARQVAAAGPVVQWLESLTRLFERSYPRPAVLHPLYRWIIGSYIFRGYQQGLKDHA
jgi:glycosyltransferase involved in cell wall biosynthesis